MDTKRWMLLAAVMLTSGLMLSPSFSSAQDAPPQRGQRQRDPAAMRERMNQMMKERLACTDEEWTVIGPRLEKVMTLNRQVSTGGMGRAWGGRGGRGGQPDQEAQADQPEVVQKAQALNTVLEDANATDAQVSEALKAYRDARDAAEKELDQARSELRELLTVKQEAQLVMMGMLE